MLGHMRGRKRSSEWEGAGELGLIEGIRGDFAGLGGGSGLALGIGDDCAILRPPRGMEVLVTTDMTLEGRHFRRDLHPAESVGHRCLARGLSDVAAMGARPTAAFLSLALPPEMLVERAGRMWVGRFFEGLRALAERVGVPLAGGDTAEAMGGLIMADIVLVGAAVVGRSLRRSGAKVGDGLYVTGALGGAAAELEGMLARAPDGAVAGGWAGRVRGWATAGVQARHPQMFPQPRLGVGTALLRRRLATACMDVSDGLSTDVAHLVRESGLGAEVMLGALPVHGMAARRSEWERLALDGGEDYELLFTAAAGVRVPGMIDGVPVTRIGTMVRRRAGSPPVTAVGADGSRRELPAGGWEHFSGGR
jgi:thiamine-monophosphate kinase